MKKEYKDLELEVVDFEAEDVITASGLPCEIVIAPCKPLECTRLCECFGPMDCPDVGCRINCIVG